MKPTPASNSDQRNDEEEETWDDKFGLVEETDKGFKLSMQMPCLLYPHVIGKNGENVSKIEKDTGTHIKFPKQGQEGEVVITGPQRSGVVGARRRIEVTAKSARQNFPFTHFLCFPLYEIDLEEKVNKFKDRVLKECSKCQGIDASIYGQLASKTHLTIGMLKLLSNKEEQNAADLLSECYQELVRECLQDTAVEIELKGVECMNDNPAEVDNLYAKVLLKDGSDRLQKLADAIVERFVSKGLMEEQDKQVKLHATVMQSKLRNTNRSEKKLPFDAKDIIRLFEDFSFGEYHLGTIHLSIRGSYDAEGHYECARSVPLPQEPINQ